MRKQIDFTSFDGTKINMVQDTVDCPKGVIIIVHGLCEHLGRYEYLASKFNEAGYTTYRYDQRGHGHSGGNRIYFDKFTDMTDDLHAIYEFVKNENPKSKIFLVGHSMGGQTVICFGTRFPGLVNGIVTTGALTRQNNDSTGSFPIDLPADQYVENGFAEGVCSDPVVMNNYIHDELCDKKISVGLLNCCWDGVCFLKEHAADFTDPVLVLHGADDGIVSEKDSREFFGDISSKDKSLRIYAFLYHELLNEPCKDQIIKEIIEWIDSH